MISPFLLVEFTNTIPMTATPSTKNDDTHSTLADVARRAGVGTSTVSRVINGGKLVGAETLERVRAAIRELHFQPNQAARILKGELTKTIGLIVPSVADPFFASCAEAAQEIARSHGFLLIVICSNNDPRMEIEGLNKLIQRRVDGLLLAPAASRNEEVIQILNRTPIPVVSFDRPLYNSSVRAVLSSNFRGAKEATGHLISHGYKRILCLGMRGEDSLYTNKERILGYRHAMQNGKFVPKVDVSMTSYESAEAILKTHLKEPNPPDAIFALRNLVTIYTYQALRQMNIKVPQKVALIGFDDFQWASTLQPSITVVKQQIQRMGEIAAELLFDKLMPRRKSRAKTPSAGKRPASVRLETELILRGSCGCHERSSRPFSD
jgi:LacI family transcriptional regulator